MKKPLVAVQLYSVRDAMERDFFGVLKQVKDMGYAGVEFAGFYNHSAIEIKRFLEKIGLKAVSSHVPIDSLIDDINSVIDFHKILGCNYIAIPWLDEPRRPGKKLWPQVVAQIKEIAQSLKNADIQLLYHNHDFEFVKIGNKYALDLLYEDVSSSLLATEIDTCWVNVAGVNPSVFLLKYSDRSPVVHLKDFVKKDCAEDPNMYALIDSEGKDNKKFESDDLFFEFRPLGMGQQNMPEILKTVTEIGSDWIVVEQDRSSDRSSMEAIQISREYLKTLGY